MKITRKIYMSLFTTMFILLTCVVTTFAWVGIFTTSTIGSFDLNLMVQDPKDGEDYLRISATGEENSFDEAVALTDIQTQIMSNMGINYANVNETEKYSLYNSYEDYINYTFTKKAELTPVTPGFDSTKASKIDLSYFYEFENFKFQNRELVQSTKYFKFDLYLTVDTPSGIQSSTDINAKVLFANISDALSSNITGGDIITLDPFSSISSTDPKYGVLSNVNGTVRMKSVNATRLAFEIYNPIKISDSYVGNETPHSTIIYQGGTQNPKFDSSTSTYNFGGILPKDYNLALKEANTLYKSNLDIYNKNSLNENLYDSAIYRYENNIDKEMVNDNKVIWDSPSTISGLNYLGVQNGIQTKIKISCYFWFEGWDADCLRFIDKKAVDIKLVFSTDRKE